MSLKLGLSSRLLAVSALATLTLTTVAEAQPYGLGRGGGGMMGVIGDGGWVTEWAASEGSACLCSHWSFSVSPLLPSAAVVPDPHRGAKEPAGSRLC